MEANHSHISEPSNSMATLVYPPPRKTTTAAPVFPLVGENTFIVGFGNIFLF